MWNASVTANGTSRRSVYRAGKKPARRRASQLPDLREAQYSDLDLVPHPLLSQQDFSRFVLDFLVFGNAFLKSA
jgi:capsid portal protein